MVIENKKTYILDQGKIYRLNSDYTQTEITAKEFEEAKKRDPKSIIILDRDIFLQEKSILLDKNHPASMSEDAARRYFKMGFITKEELEKYLN
jgi:hypothetical protein